MAALGAAGLGTAGLALAAKGKALGVQLYTIRTLVPNKAREAMQAIAQIGYTEVETLRAIHPTVLPLCKEFGLKPVASHFDLALITGQTDAAKAAFQKAIEEAQGAGIKYVVVPYVPNPDRGGPDVYKRMAKQLNEAGALCAKAGLQLCYHQHAFEFGESQGQRPWDILLSETEARTYYSPEVHEEFLRAGFYRMLVPRRFGAGPTLAIGPCGTPREKLWT